MVGDLLSVLMDGINDTNMLLDYCNRCDDQDIVNFFHNHAKKRYEEVTSDFVFVKSHIGLEQKMRDEDPIAEALHTHIVHEMNKLRDRLNAG